MQQPQVHSSHYEFFSYMKKGRWASMWHQLDEILRLQPATVLEIGPGPGILRAVARTLSVQLNTLDIDPTLAPDHVGSALALPFADNSFDIACAFQVLEHFPFSDSLIAFRELARVARRQVVVSLPDARRIWQYSFDLPRIGRRTISIPRPRLIPPPHHFDGEHYWEIGKRNYSLRTVTTQLQQASDTQLVRNYRVTENAYHHFFIFDTKR